MNSRTTKDIPCFRSYLPDALRLRFEDKLTIRAIAQRPGLSHSTMLLYPGYIALILPSKQQPPCVCSVNGAGKLTGLT